MVISTKETNKKYDGFGQLKSEVKYWENGKIRSIKNYRYGLLENETKWNASEGMRVSKVYHKEELIKEYRWDDDGTRSSKKYRNNELSKEYKWSDDGMGSCKEYLNGRLEREREWDENRKTISDINYLGKGELLSNSRYNRY